MRKTRKLRMQSLDAHIKAGHVNQVQEKHIKDRLSRPNVMKIGLIYIQLYTICNKN